MTGDRAPITGPVQRPDFPRDDGQVCFLISEPGYSSNHIWIAQDGREPSTVFRLPDPCQSHEAALALPFRPNFEHPEVPAAGN